MKKKLAKIIVVIIMFSLTVNAFAADALYRMLHADDVEQFKVDQDAIIIGQIVEENETVYKVRVLECISGKVDAENLLIDKDFQYAGFSEEKSQPAIDDFCVLSVKKNGDIYKLAWYAVKADSGDYKNLKLIYEAKRFGGGDIPAIQWYINSGGVDKDFYFSSGKVYVRTPDGKDIDITDISLETGTEATITTIPSKNEEQTNDKIISNEERETKAESPPQPKNSKESEANEKSVSKIIHENMRDNRNNSLVIYLLLCVIVIIIVTIILYKLRGTK